MKRSELRDRFDEIYSILSPAAARLARQARIEKLQG